MEKNRLKNSKEQFLICLSQSVKTIFDGKMDILFRGDFLTVYRNRELNNHRFFELLVLVLSSHTQFGSNTQKHCLINVKSSSCRATPPHLSFLIGPHSDSIINFVIVCVFKQMISTLTLNLQFLSCKSKAIPVTKISKTQLNFFQRFRYSTFTSQLNVKCCFIIWLFTPDSAILSSSICSYHIFVFLFGCNP